MCPKWSELVQDRNKWRTLILEGKIHFGLSNEVSKQESKLHNLHNYKYLC